MEHTYQQISAADLPTLKSLLAVFGEAFGEPDTYQGAVPSDAYPTASAEEAPVSSRWRPCATARWSAAWPRTSWRSSSAPRSEIYIFADLAVREGERRKAVWRPASSARSASSHRERGAYVMFVQGDRGDAPAIRPSTSPLSTREDVHHFDIAPADYRVSRLEGPGRYCAWRSRLSAVAWSGTPWCSFRARGLLGLLGPGPPPSRGLAPSSRRPSGSLSSPLASRLGCRGDPARTPPFPGRCFRLRHYCCCRRTQCWGANLPPR